MALIPALMPLFIIPSAKNISFSKASFPFQQLLFALFGFFLISLNPELKKEKTDKKFIYKFLWTIGTFVVLTIISFLLQKIGTLISHAQISEIQKPVTVSDYIYCILNFLFSAFYEESLYWFFLPEALLYLTRNYKDRKMVQIDCEIISCVLFATGHIYLGFLAILLAAIAYIILRLCFKKTSSLLPGTAAHFLYNLSQLLFF